MPAVFSHTFPMNFNRNVTGDELCKHLADWLEALTLWAIDNHCFVGHIKIFAESGDSFSLWLSSTGKEINVRNPWQGSDTVIRQANASVTAIVFGADEERLKAAAMERWNEIIKKPDKK